MVLAEHEPLIEIELDYDLMLQLVMKSVVSVVHLLMLIVELDLDDFHLLMMLIVDLDLLQEILLSTDVGFLLEGMNYSDDDQSVPC